MRKCEKVWESLWKCTEYKNWKNWEKMPYISWKPKFWCALHMPNVVCPYVGICIWQFFIRLLTMFVVWFCLVRASYTDCSYSICQELHSRNFYSAFWRHFWSIFLGVGWGGVKVSLSTALLLSKITLPLEETYLLQSKQ